jgi:hypothetical protein
MRTETEILNKIKEIKSSRNSNADIQELSFKEANERMNQNFAILLLMCELSEVRKINNKINEKA